MGNNKAFYLKQISILDVCILKLIFLFNAIDNLAHKSRGNLFIPFSNV